jgi:polar amino acid transport system substrate-binding protein
MSIRSLVFGFSLLIIFALNASAYGCALKVRTYEFPPMATQDALGNWTGMDIDYIDALLNKAGCSYTLVDMHWARAIRMIKEGELDLMLNVSKTKQRRTSMHFIGPQRIEEIRFVSKKGLLPVINHWQQFAALQATLIRQRGTYMGERLKRTLNRNPLLNSRVVTLPSSEVKLELIEMGRADGFFAQNVYLAHQLKTNPAFSVVEVQPLVIHQAPVYFAFSKTSMSGADILRIRSAYLQLSQTSQLEEIIQRYTLPLPVNNDPT